MCICVQYKYNRHGQSGSHFLILHLKISKQEHSFISSGIKAHTFGAKKDILPVPYFTVFGTLQENSLCVLRFYGKVPLTFLYIFIAKAWIFLWGTDKEESLSRSS